MRVLIAVVLCAAACGNNHNLIAPRPVSPDAVRKACAMELSCLSPAPIMTGGGCVTQFEEGLATGYGIFFGPSAADLARYVDCANSQPDCTSTLKCASKNHGPDWCNAHTGASCDGDTLVNCVSGWGLELTDCTQVGLRCMSANGVSLCSDGKSCDPASDGTCSGNSFVSCNDTARIGSSIDCGSFLAGGTCRHIVTGTSSSETGCFGPGSASCPATAQEMDSCDGTALVACSYGTSFRIECGQFASHCVAGTNGGKYSCVPDASDCTDQSPDSCVGNAIQMCVNGKWQTQACGSFGLSTCQSSAMGVKCS